MNREIEDSATAWVEYYKAKPTSIDRISEIAIRHNFLLTTILAHDPEVAIEIGIGTGALGFSLQNLSEETGSDISVIEVDYNATLLEDVASFIGPSRLKYVTANTFDLPFEHNDTSLIFHQGLLEHFTNEQIHAVLNAQLKVAPVVIASVPSEKFNFTHALRGDERLMDKEQWSEILRPFNSTIEYYGEFPGEQYHLCMTISNLSTDSGV